MRPFPTVLAALFLSASAAGAGPRVDPFPDTSEGVHMEMVFNYNMNGQYSLEAGVVDAVWGSDVPDQPQGVYNSWYIPFNVDDFTNSVDWYRENHPDWLAYQCDRRTLAYVPGSDRAPLDFANPEVRAYQWQNWIDAKLDMGYPSIAVDLLALTNDQNRCGHYAKDGTTWVPEYKHGAVDLKTYRRDVLEWERLTYRHIHDRDPSATMQVNVTYAYDTLYPDQNLQLMTTADLLFDERGFTEFGYAAAPSPQHWQVIVDKIDDVHGRGLCYTLENEVPGSNADITPAERQWAMGNYLLVKDNRKNGKRSCDYMYVSGQQYYGFLAGSDDYKIAVGHPTAKRVLKQGVWQREYSAGLVLVNPSLAAAHVKLPRGNWTDIAGHGVGRKVTLDRQTALVLLKGE
jgi:hypothetical protein